MARDTYKNIRLGVFVVAAALLLIASLYFVGAKQNLFGNTFEVQVEFRDVNGLMPGHNVRLSGIDVGSVKSVEIVSDSLVRVTLMIEESVQQYIRKNAVVYIGTDGLMGNKLVNITSGTGISDIVEEGDMLTARSTVDPDEMIRTLNKTNENIEVISTNLRTITDKINSENSLWSLLMDTVMAANVKASIVNIRVASDNSAVLTGNLASLSQDVRDGKGTLGALIVDTTIAGHLKQVIVKFENINDSVAVITGNISEIVNGIQNGKGSVGVLLNDTTLVHNMNEGVANINTGAVLLNEDLTAVHESWPFRRYFRKQGRMNQKKK